MRKKGEERSNRPEHGAGNIHARVIDAENGLRLLSGVYAVRIQSRDYNLLIMDDYLPVMGKIEGNIIFLTDEEEFRLEKIKGFYKHQHNEFTLLIEERDPAGAPRQEAAP